MDDIMDNSQITIVKSSAIHAIFPAVLFSLIMIFTALGMKLFHNDGYFGSLSFYNRYEGISLSGTPEGLLLQLTEVLICALPVLVLIFSLYLLSFSPFLVPASIITLSLRAFILGAGISAVEDWHRFIQAGVYAVITLAICIMVIFFYRKRNNLAKNIFEKTVLLFSVSGFCVLCEGILSFVL